MVALKNLVLDASVVYKWVSYEKEDLEKALALREMCLSDEDIMVFVPAHFHSEISNIVLRFFSNEYLQFMSDLFRSKFIVCHLTLELAGICKNLMKKYPHISFYDAFYHALAMEKGGVFITADKKYYQTVKKEGNILLLKDFKQNIVE